MIEDQIAALLEKALPLRLLEDDDEAKRPLTAIVDEINALRALPVEVPEVVEVVAEPVAPVEAPARRGRPPKADVAAVEGADA